MAPKKKSPRRSPRLTKREKAKLSKKQTTKLQRAEDSAEDAASYVDAMKEGRDAQRDKIKGLQGDLMGIQDSLSKHPLLAKKAAKKQEIGIARADLADIVQELNSAKNALAAKLQSKHSVVNALQRQLRGDDDDDT